ncbi:craniofacial development protein 2-like [Clytia hemisphaerica]|uniref:craniofacial development protein 2-like n=1 Tax=Clytia hemisphaerica TaxID=252671 RepID=UPI0034D46487
MITTTANNPNLDAMGARTCRNDLMKQQRETERTTAADRTRIPIREPIILSTYNVRTLYKTGKFQQLCSGGIDAGVNIAGIQEHRLHSTDPISQKWSDDKNWLFFYNSASQSRVGGVGLLVSKNFVKCVTGSKFISDRIISVTFNGNPRLVITVAYAPTEGADTDLKDIFYGDLNNHTSNDTKRHDIHIVLGDFNARLGKDSHEFAPSSIGTTLMHDETNDNGERLIEYCLGSNPRTITLSSTSLAVVDLEASFWHPRPARPHTYQQ